MRIRSFLTSTAMTAVLLGPLSLGIGTAQAQKGITLAPSTQWAITKVDEQKGHGYTYCAMARRFESNTILTVARNQGNEASFALDFQAPKFRASAVVPVVLDPGAGEQRRFRVTPVSSKAFVVKLGRDDAFFSALERTGYLRAEVGGQTYNFNLADINIGQTKLDSCIAEMIEPAAGAATVTAETIGVPVEAGSTFRTEISALRDDIQSLRDENKRLEKVLSQKQESAGAQTGISGELAQRIDSLEQVNTTLRTQLADARIEAIENSGSAQAAAEEEYEEAKYLKTENARLKAALERKERELSSVKDLEKELRLLRSESEALQAQLDGETQKGDSLEKQKMITQLSQENERLQETLAEKSTAMDTELEGMRDTVATLEEENAALKIELENAPKLSEMLAKESTVTSLKEENSRLEKELQDMEGGQLLAAELESQIEILQGENKNLQDDLNIARKKIVGLEGQESLVEQLRQQIGDLTVQIQEKDEELVELSELSVELETLKMDNADLQQRLGSRQKDKGVIAALEQKVKTLEDEGLKLRKQLDIAESESRANQALFADIESLKADNEKLRKSLDDKGTEEEAVAKMQAELENARMQNENLQAKVALLEQEKKSMDVDLENLSAENTRLQEQIADNAGAQEELKSLRAEMKKLRAEKDDLIAALQTEKTQSESALNEEIAALKKDNETLRKTLDSDEGVQHAAIESLQADLDSLKGENKSLQAENESLNTALKEMESDKASDNLKDKVAKLRSENKTLKAQLKTSKKPDTDTAQMAALEAELETAKADNESLRGELDALVEKQAEGLIPEELQAALEENEALKKQLAEKDEQLMELADLRQEFQDLKQRNESLSSSIADAESAGPSALPASDVSALEDKLAAVEQENQELRREIDNLKSGEGDMAALRAELQSQKDKNDALQAQLAETSQTLQVQPVDSAETAALKKKIAKLEKELGRADYEKQMAMQRMAREYIALKQKLARIQGGPMHHVSVSTPVPGMKPASFASKREEAPATIIAAEMLEPNAGDDIPVRQGLHSDDVVEPRQTDQAPQKHPTLKRRSAADYASGMTEAQMQEQELRQGMGAGVSEQEPIIMRKSADPFEDIDVENDFTGYESVEGGKVQEKSAAAPMEPKNQSSSQIENIPHYGAMPASDPSQIIEQGSAAPVEDIETESLKVWDSAPAKTRAQLRVFRPGFDVRQVLSSANVSSAQSVNVVGNASDAQKIAYQWQAGDVFGSAELKPLQNVADFEGYVAQYLDKTQSRCKGDFAVSPDKNTQIGDMRMDSYEIACIGTGVDSSASLLFFNKSGTFAVMAHEAPTGNMDVAMGMRDRLYKTLGSGGS